MFLKTNSTWKINISTPRNATVSSSCICSAAPTINQPDGPFINQCEVYAELKKNIFEWCLNVVVDDCMSRSHARRAATENGLDGLRLAAPSVEERGCHCWGRAKTSVLVCRRLLRACLVTDRWMTCERVDRACTRSVVKGLTMHLAKSEERKLHGHVVTGRATDPDSLAAVESRVTTTQKSDSSRAQMSRPSCQRTERSWRRRWKKQVFCFKVSSCFWKTGKTPASYILQRGRIACNAERCNTYSNSVCPSVRLSVCPSVCLSVCHTLVPYPDLWT